MTMLVLSLFPGIGLLDRAFEEEGFCVVRGPDVLWGGDVRSFHPPAGVFDGVIGGPPCQAHSQLGVMNPLSGKQGDLIPEFERCVAEAGPRWFVMENVRGAPIPGVPDYITHPLLLNNRWLGEEQNRLRRFSFGTRDGRRLDVSADVAIFEDPNHAPTVLAGHGLPGRGRGYERYMPFAEMRRLQGLPDNFLEGDTFTVHGKRLMIGNAVPLPMGRAIARAVKRALAELEGRG